MKPKDLITGNIFEDITAKTGFKLSKSGFYLFIIVLAAVVYFPVFYGLDKLPLSIFDEGHIAVNAIEINWKKPWLATYNGSAEMWNLKPPLLLWFQRSLMYIFGYNTLAVRLPSALAALGCCMMFVFFSRKVFGNYFSGFAASICLVTSQGFMRDHVSRTGDYDALLSFFILSAFLLFFIYIYTLRKKYIYFAAAALLGGLLTKGVAAIIFAPAILLFLIYEKKLAHILKQKSFWLAGILVLVVIASYYFLRDTASPGYFRKVVEGEWFGIPMTVVQEHSGPWYFYITYFLKIGFVNYVIFLFAAIVAYMLLPKNALLHRFAVYCLLFILVQVVVLSASASKFPWYDAPVYPVAALLTGVFIAQLFKFVAAYISKTFTRIHISVIYTLLLTAFFARPYVSIIQNIGNMPASNWVPMLYQGYMSQLKNEKPHFANYIIGYEGFNEQIVFFGRAYNNQFGYKIGWQHISQKFNKGDTVISCEKIILDTIQTQYNYKLLHQSGNCATLVLQDLK